MRAWTVTDALTPEPPPNGRNGSGLQGMLSRACWYSITNTEKKQAKIFTFFAGVQFIPFRSPSPRMRGGGFQPGGAALLTVFPFFARFCSAALPRNPAFPSAVFLSVWKRKRFFHPFLYLLLPSRDGNGFLEIFECNKGKIGGKAEQKSGSICILRAKKL